MVIALAEAKAVVVEKVEQVADGLAPQAIRLVEEEQTLHHQLLQNRRSEKTSTTGAWQNAFALRHA